MSKSYKYLVSHNQGDSVAEQFTDEELQTKYIIQEFQPNKTVGPWYVVDTHYDIKKILKAGIPQKKWYGEVISTRRPIKIYFDIETNKLINRETLLERIIGLILNTYNKLYPDTNVLTRDNIFVYSSHSNIKTSWHIVVNNTYVRDYRECAHFARTLIENDHEIESVIDMSVYSKMRAFRILGTTKNEIPCRYKVPCNSTPKYLLNSLVTEIPSENSIVLPVTEIRGNEHMQIQKEIIDIYSNDDKIINLIVEHLNPMRSDKYETWSEVGYTLFNIYKGSSVGLQIFDKFSQKSKKYPGQIAINKFWKKLNNYADTRENETKLKVGTLYYWLRQDNPDQYNKIKSEDVNRTLEKMSTNYLEDHKNTFTNQHIINVDYLGQYYNTSEKLDNIINNFEHLIIKSPTGSGKTAFTAELVARLIEKNNNTILSLVSRQVLGYELMRSFSKNKVFLFNYLDISKTDHYELEIKDFDKLICSIDSFHRVKNPNEYTILYIDEMDSFLEHMFSETLKNRPHKFQLLCECIQRCKHVICSDADISDMTLGFLSRLLNINKTLYIHNTIKKDNFTCLFYTKRSHLLGTLINSIKKGEKNYICSDSKELIENIYQFIYKYCRQQSIRDSLRLYTSIDGNKKDIIDVDTKWKESNVFTSPTVVYGISFSPLDPAFYFDNVFGIYKNGTINARAQAQQLARPRQIKSGKMHIYSMFNPARCKLPTSYKEIESIHKKIDDVQERYLRHDSNYLMGKLKIDPITNFSPAPIDINNEALFTQLYFYHCKNKYLSQRDPTFELMKILKEKGDKIVPYYSVPWMTIEFEQKIQKAFQKSNKDFKEQLDFDYAKITKLDDISGQKEKDITIRQYNLTNEVVFNVENLGYSIEFYPKIIENIILTKYVRDSRYHERLNVLQKMLLKEEELTRLLRNQYEYKEMRTHNLLAKVKLLFELERYLEIKRFTNVIPNFKDYNLKKSEITIIRETKLKTRVNQIFPGIFPKERNKLTFMTMYCHIIKLLTGFRIFPETRYFQTITSDKVVKGIRYRTNCIVFNKAVIATEIELILMRDPHLINVYNSESLKIIEGEPIKFGYLRKLDHRIKTLKEYIDMLKNKFEKLV
jgi:DNA polymerase III delta prime subunit